MEIFNKIYKVTRQYSKTITAARQQNNINTGGRRRTGEGEGTVRKVNGSNIDS